MIQFFDSELKILLKTSISDIEKKFGERIAQGIAKVRKQDIYVDPGFDGEFGKVKIWHENKEKIEKEEPPQLGLF